MDDVNNTRNSHSRAQKNPHEAEELIFDRGFLVHIWRGTQGNYLLGPHFTANPLRVPRYRNFLENELKLCFDNVRLVRTWWTCDGAIPHFATVKVLQ